METLTNQLKAIETSRKVRQEAMLTSMRQRLKQLNDNPYETKTQTIKRQSLIKTIVGFGWK